MVDYVLFVYEDNGNWGLSVQESGDALNFARGREIYHITGGNYVNSLYDAGLSTIDNLAGSRLSPMSQREIEDKIRGLIS